MANTARIPLDNFTQNGDTTLGELLDAVAAVNSGTKPGVSDIVRDPASGKLVRVELTFPDAVATAAINAINANPGVPTTVVPCPAQLFARDLSDSAPDGIVYDQVLLANDQHVITAVAGSVLGQLRNVGAGNVYTDLADQLGASAFKFQMSNFSSTTDFTLATGHILTFNFSATQSVTVSLTNDIVVPKVAPGIIGNAIQVYLDVAGKAYSFFSQIDGVRLPLLSYEESCAAGAL